MKIKKELLLVVFLLLGIVGGVLLQYYHLPGQVLWAYNRARDSLTVTVDPGQTINLQIRDFDGRERIYRTEKIAIEQAALILIDVWPGESYPDSLKTKISPLVKAFREHGIMTIHSPNGREVHELIGVMSNEVVLPPGLEGRTQLIKLLQQKNIEYLFFAGYLSNMCVLNRPTGIAAMAFHGYKNKIIFVRDASVSGTMPSVEQSLVHEVVVTAVIELNWGTTTTVADILTALEN